MKSDSVTSNSIEGVGLKAVAGDVPSSMSGSPSSCAIPTENGSENPANISTVYATLLKQGERMDRILDLFQNQAKMLQDHGKSIKTHEAALATHGNARKTQGNLLEEQRNTLKEQRAGMEVHQMIIAGVFQKQQELGENFEHVKKEVGSHVAILKQQEMRLKVLEGRLDRLCKDRGDGNPVETAQALDAGLDVKPLESNTLLLVPLNFSTIKWNGMIEARLRPVCPYGIIQQNFQSIFKDSNNLQ